MIEPIAREEQYLSNIVGWSDTSPEPLTREEIFYTEILGKASKILEPITRVEHYLAKIAGRDIEVPYPETRLEYFLAKAAGMDVKTPVPVTREEIFWDNYSAVQELEGIPPIVFTSKGKDLKNYRIYGNTVDGESVGDLVNEGEHVGEYRVPVTVEGKNLLQNMATSQTINGVTFTVNDDKSITIFGELTSNNATFVVANSSGIPGRLDHSSAIIAEGLMIISTTTNDSIQLRAQYTDDTYKGIITNGVPFTIPKDIGMVYIQVTESLPEPVTIYPMIRKAYIEDDTYEPYHEPITTNLYLPEPLKMVGDEAEYVDYQEQKQQRVRKNLLKNTATSQTINDVTFTVNDEGIITISGSKNKSGLIYFDICFVNTDDINGKIFTGYYGVSSSYNDGMLFRFSPLDEDMGVDVLSDNTTINLDSGLTLRLRIRLSVNVNVPVDITVKPMIRKAYIEDDTYEPYISDTELDVELPELPTIVGTNILSVDTQVQPSKVYVEGQIKTV